jgi:predicted ester cyclase
VTTEKLTEFCKALRTGVVQSAAGGRRGFLRRERFAERQRRATTIGRAAIAEVARGFMRDLPDIIVTMNDLKIGGRSSCEATFHWTFTGTNTGSGGTGNRVRISGYELWKISDDGLIAESKGHFDAAEYERQLERPV